MNKKTFITISIIIILLVGYLIIINYFATYEYNKILSNNNAIIKSKENVNDVKIDIGESVGVSIKRNRWYGTIKGVYGKDKSIENLYLFNLIKMPIIINNISWIWIHFLAISLFITIPLFISFILFGSQTKSEVTEYKEPTEKLKTIESYSNNNQLKKNIELKGGDNNMSWYEKWWSKLLGILGSGFAFYVLIGDGSEAILMIMLLIYFVFIRNRNKGQKY